MASPGYDELVAQLGRVGEALWTPTQPRLEPGYYSLAPGTPEGSRFPALQPDGLARRSTPGYTASGHLRSPSSSKAGACDDSHGSALSRHGVPASALEHEWSVFANLSLHINDQASGKRRASVRRESCTDASVCGSKRRRSEANGSEGAWTGVVENGHSSRHRRRLPRLPYPGREPGTWVLGRSFPAHPRPRPRPDQQQQIGRPGPLRVPGPPAARDAAPRESPLTRRKGRKLGDCR